MPNGRESMGQLDDALNSSQLPVVGTETEEYKRFREEMTILLDSNDPAKAKMAQDILTSISGAIINGDRRYVHDGRINVVEAVTITTKERRAEIMAAVSEAKVEMAQGINSTNRDAQAQDPLNQNQINDIKQTSEYKEAAKYFYPILDELGYDEKKKEQITTEAATVEQQRRDIEELMKREGLPEDKAIQKYFNGDMAKINLYRLSVEALKDFKETDEDRKKASSQNQDASRFVSKMRTKADDLSKYEQILRRKSCSDRQCRNLYCRAHKRFE